MMIRYTTVAWVSNLYLTSTIHDNLSWIHQKTRPEESFDHFFHSLVGGVHYLGLVSIKVVPFVF